MVYVAMAANASFPRIHSILQRAHTGCDTDGYKHVRGMPEGLILRSEGGEMYTPFT